MTGILLRGAAARASVSSSRPRQRRQAFVYPCQVSAVPCCRAAGECVRYARWPSSRIRRRGMEVAARARTPRRDFDDDEDDEELMGSYEEDDDELEEEDEEERVTRRRRPSASAAGGDEDDDDDDEVDDEFDDEELEEQKENTDGIRDALDDVADAEDMDEEDAMLGRAKRRGTSFDEGGGDLDDEDERMDEGLARGEEPINGFGGRLPESSTDEPDLDLDAFLAEQGMPRDLEEADVQRMIAAEEDQGEVRLSEEVDDIDEWVKSWPVPPDRAFTLPQLLRLAGLAGVVSSGPPPGIEVSGLACDSRRVKEGDLFVCVAGAKADGHDFAASAVKAGAVAVVAAASDLKLDRAPPGVPVVRVDDTHFALSQLARAFYDDPSRKMLTVGITGTNGKTTTSWLVRGILEEAEHLTGMVGTIEYALCNQLLSDDGQLWKDTPEGQERDIQDIIQEEWDAIHFESKAAEEGRVRLLAHALPYHVDKYQGRYSVPNTTPNALQIQQLMAGMADRGGSACVMECSSIGLDQGRCDGVDFDVAVFMNLSQDHLDYHGTMENYLAAKARLFEGLSDPGRQRAVINVDDVFADRIKASARDVPIVTFAVNDRTADVTVEAMGLTTLQEMDITIRSPLGSFQVITPLIGLQNVYNLLAATAVGISVNIPIESIAAGLEAVDCVPGRMEKVEEGQAFSVIVDYAHTPDALEYLLNSVKSISGIRRIILVFGCGGDRDRAKRKVMMEIANEKADIVIVTTDNPRSEDPQSIFDDMSHGLPKHWGAQPSANGDYTWFADPSTCVPWENNIIWDKQSFYKRYVIEDRHYAIRGALSIADEKDVVIIAGKGHEDYQEWEVEGQIIKSWFSDQQEVRSAVNVLGGLYKLPMNRKSLPWEAL